VSKFFRFYKRIWIPLLVIILAATLWAIIEPMLPAIAQLAFAFLFQLIQIVTWIFLFFGILAGRVRIHKYKPGDLDLTWDDYRGNPEVIKRVKAWVGYLKGDPRFDEMGGEHEPGVLLKGKPGTGKTWLAKVLASMAGVPLWSVSCQSLLGTFMGIGPLKVKGLFNGVRNEAIKSGKGAILFLDEFDSIGGTRGGLQMPPMKYHPWQTGYWIGKQMPFMGGMGSQILNVILEELDGMTEKVTWGFRLRKALAQWMGFGPESKFYPRFDRPRVMVICSTNRPDVLDPALTRRGRIGTDLLVDIPSVQGLEDIAEYYLDEHRHPSGMLGVVHDETLTAEVIAQTAAGRTPADVKWFLNTAVDKAVLAGKDKVYIHDWMEALAEGVMGTKNPLPLSEEERVLLATHEAGHAIVLLAVAKDRLKPMFLTTERYGGALGHMYPVETLTWYLGATQEMLEGAGCMLLAGAVAEEVIAGIRHNSMGGDMPGVWRIMRVMAWNGMLGRLPLEPEDKRLLKPMREKMNELWERTKTIVEQNRDVFDSLVPALVEKRTLAGPEVMELIGEKVKKWEVKDENRNEST
jgi:cell division protease FtsH